MLVIFWFYIVNVDLDLPTFLSLLIMSFFKVLLRCNLCTRDFRGGPAVKALFPLQGAQVRSLVRELISHIPCGVAKKRKKVVHIPCHLNYTIQELVFFFFSIFIELFNHHHNQFQNILHLSKRNLIPISDHFPFTTSFQSFATPIYLVSIDTCCSFRLPSFT